MKLLEFVFANLALQHTIFHMKVTQGHVLKKIYEQFRVSYVDATFKDFSRYVDIPTSRMSEYVNNKRKITPVAIDKIATKLSLAEPLKADLERTAMEYGSRKQKHLNRRLLSSFDVAFDPAVTPAPIFRTYVWCKRRHLKVVFHVDGQGIYNRTSVMHRSTIPLKRTDPQRSCPGRYHRDGLRTDGSALQKPRSRGSHSPVRSLLHRPTAPP